MGVKKRAMNKSCVIKVHTSIVYGLLNKYDALKPSGLKFLMHSKTED